MPRPPRLLLSKSYYHIMTRGNNRNIVFRDEIDYEYYLELVRRFKELLPFNLFHYCLMPNHTHFLIQTLKAEDFSSFMKRLNLAYFHYFNKKYSWIGHFWQDRFKSQPVGKDEYFIQCGKYIELNPIRAGLVDDPADYLYSSYRYYVKQKSDKLITPDIFYEQLGDQVRRKKEYAELLVSEIVKESYDKKTWGSSNQRYNENRKKHYHLG